MPYSYMYILTMDFLYIYQPEFFILSKHSLIYLRGFLKDIIQLFLLTIILLQIRGMTNYCRLYSPTQSTLQVLSKIKGMDCLEDFIKLIYAKKISFYEIDQFVKFLTFQIGYGTVYTLIRENLQNVCRTHRMLITQSTKTIIENLKYYYLITFRAKYQMKEQFRFLKEYQSIAMIIYYHYSSISQSNKQICQLWQEIKQKQSFINSQKDSHIKTPELKLLALNQLTLKELISDLLYLTNFQGILERLYYSSLIHEGSKKQIKQMLDVCTHKEFNHSKLLGQTKFEQIEDKKKQTKSWLEQLKSEAIGKRYSSILQQKFGQKDDEKNFSMCDEKTVSELAKGLFPQKLLTLGSGSIKLRITTLSDEDQQLQKQIEIFELNMKMRQENAEKKKKKKKKKKKTKEPNENEQQVKQGMKEQSIQKNYMDSNSLETINLLKQMKIDYEKRVSCVELNQLQKWRKMMQIDFLNN